MKTTLLPHLQNFLVVARTRSFTSAARELGVTPSAVSQSVRHLESELEVALLTRTTRSVAVTDVGRRLLEQAGPGLTQALTALTTSTYAPGAVSGRLKLTVPQIAAPYVISPVLPTFLARYPHVEVEVVFEQRLVDIVAEGYDAGVRLAERLERDMVQVRLTKPFRFVVVGSPDYLAKHGVPKKPEDLLRHECLPFRSATTGELYPWDLERGRKSWRVPVHGRAMVNDAHVGLALAETGAALAYVFEPLAASHLKERRLVVVLEEFAAIVPGFFLYFPSRAQSSPALRAFVETAKECAVQQ